MITIHKSGQKSTYYVYMRAGLLPRRPRRRAGTAHGRAIRGKTPRVEEAGFDRFAAIGHAVARRVGPAVGGGAMAPARIARRSGAPVLGAEATGQRLRGRRNAPGYKNCQSKRQQPADHGSPSRRENRTPTAT